jgi:hypothetical protein
MEVVVEQNIQLLKYGGQIGGIEMFVIQMELMDGHYKQNSLKKF